MGRFSASSGHCLGSTRLVIVRFAMVLLLHYSFCSWDVFGQVVFQLVYFSFGRRESVKDAWCNGGIFSLGFCMHFGVSLTLTSCQSNGYTVFAALLGIHT